MSYNFLVMDDSPIIRSVLKKCLLMSGVEVGEIYMACNGKEGLATLNKEKVDILFADLNMPELDGKSVIKEMASTSMIEKIPVVVISSERNALVKMELLKLGVREFVGKPFTPEQMQRVVKKVLETPWA